MRDYRIVSPSLEGVLSESSLSYEGVKRPLEVLRIMDGPSSKGAVSGSKPKRSLEDQKVLEGYFHDLYGIFMKRLACFVVDSVPADEEEVKLQAMLQEMLKIKGLIARC